MLDETLKSRHSLSLNLLPSHPQDEKEAQSIEFESGMEHAEIKKQAIEKAPFQMNPKSSSNPLVTVALSHYTNHLSSKQFGHFNSSSTEQTPLVKKRALVSYSSEDE